MTPQNAQSEKSCNNCKFAVFQDYGYSNYTVEGTEFECRKQAHPEGDFDRWYGEDEKLKFGAKCPSYENGEPIEMDCDHENEADLTPEQKEIYESE